MKLAIMQPYFFPYIGYFQLIHAVDKILLYENLDYMPKSWMTRNRILQKNGEPFYFHISVNNKSHNRKISEVQIVEDTHWKKKLLKSLYANYSYRNHFKNIFPVIEQIVNFQSNNLHEFIAHSIKTIAQLLDIKTEIVSNNSKYLSIENYLTEKYRSGVNIDHRKIDRLLLIAKEEKATTFINAIGGVQLYSKEELAKNNLELFFVKTGDLVYQQFSKTFYPNLSILDVLFNCGIDQTKQWIENYELI